MNSCPSVYAQRTLELLSDVYCTITLKCIPTEYVTLWMNEIQIRCVALKNAMECMNFVNMFFTGFVRTYTCEALVY